MLVISHMDVHEFMRMYDRLWRVDLELAMKGIVETAVTSIFWEYICLKVKVCEDVISSLTCGQLPGRCPMRLRY